MFMLLSVLSVMRCTSIAWMVAPKALAFCSNQNCTVLSSWMRLSNSSGSIVGAIQALAALAEPPVPAPKFFMKSNPGTNWVKSKPGVLDIVALLKVGQTNSLNPKLPNLGLTAVVSCSP